MEVFNKADPTVLGSKPEVDLTIEFEVVIWDESIIMPISKMTPSTTPMPHAQKIDYPGERENGVDAIAYMNTAREMLIIDKETDETVRVIFDDGSHQQIDVYQREEDSGIVYKARLIVDPSRPIATEE